MRYPEAGLVPKAGVEPALPFGNTPLKRARLPVSPLRLLINTLIDATEYQGNRTEGGNRTHTP